MDVRVSDPQSRPDGKEQPGSSDGPDVYETGAVVEAGAESTNEL